eukprot:555921_1
MSTSDLARAYGTLFSENIIQIRPWKDYTGINICGNKPCKHVIYKFSHGMEQHLLRLIPRREPMGRNLSPLCKHCLYGLFAEFQNDLPYCRLLFTGFITEFDLNKFIYCHTDAWIWAIDNCVSYIDMAINTQKITIDGQNLVLYEILAPLVNNIGLLKRKHWKFITFTSPLILKIFEFVIKMLDLSLKMGHIMTPNLSVLLVFYWKWLEYFMKYKAKNSDKCMDVHKKLIQFYTDMELILSESGLDYKNGKVTFVIRGFYEAMDKYSKYQDLIDDQFGTLWHVRRENGKCQRLKCKLMRKNKNKWLICSKCLVATYCSKKCAKYNWKYGNHKKYCQTYYQVRNMDSNEFDSAW